MLPVSVAVARPPRSLPHADGGANYLLLTLFMFGLTAFLVVIAWWYTNGPEMIQTGGALAPPLTPAAAAAVVVMAVPPATLKRPPLPRLKRPSAPVRPRATQWTLDPPSPNASTAKK
jgi:hypothetical protein